MFLLDVRYFRVQQKLDDKINETKKLSAEDFIHERQLALLTELGELANEQRSWKFWSNDKQPRTHVAIKVEGRTEYKNLLLEEFVDCVHFLLSIGNYSGFVFHDDDVLILDDDLEGDITDLFLLTYRQVTAFIQEPTPTQYLDVWCTLMSLGKKMGFNSHEILIAYLEKNKENFERQDNGY